jgi:surface antigen
VRAEYARPAFLGNAIDRAPPTVDVVAGGPTGVLLTGPYVPDVPDAAVDGVIAGGLKSWLTFAERQNLAMASERAAVATTGEPVAWTAQDGGGEVTATGSAVAVGQPFRSLRGGICRDVRQSFAKDGTPHAQTVSLCRSEIVTGIELWVVSLPD